MVQLTSFMITHACIYNVQEILLCQHLQSMTKCQDYTALNDQCQSIFTVENLLILEIGTVATAQCNPINFLNQGSKCSSGVQVFAHLGGMKV